MDIPPNKILSLVAEMYIVRKGKVILPVHNFLVRLVWSLRAERRITNEALKHDCSQRPPITFVAITLEKEYLGRNIIRCPDC